MTVAFEKSVSKRSAFTNAALAVTFSLAAFFFDSSTMSGLYSMPIAVAPRLAAVITVRPSPEPRSMTKSCGVTLAMSSILSTSACDVGTHTTSLPACPTLGSNGCGRFLSGCRLRVRADGQQADPKGQPGPPDHTSCIHKKTPDKADVGIKASSPFARPVCVARGSKTAQIIPCGTGACLPARRVPVHAAL